jgi:AbrB family looped-hinge helix DNA binding protein
MQTSVLTSKGQLLIPVKLRKKYGMESGTKLMFEEAENGLVIRPVNKQYFKSLRGILSATGKLKEEMKAYKTEEKKKEDRKLNLHKKRR